MKLTKNLVTIPTALQIGTRKRSFTANLWSLTTHTYRVTIIVTGDFSKKSFFVPIFRSNCSSRQVLLGICNIHSIHNVHSIHIIAIFQPCPKRDFKWKLQNFYEQLFLWNTSGGCFCQFDLLLIKNKICMMVSTKNVCRSGQSMLLTHY